LPTYRLKKIWSPFPAAREFVQSLRLASRHDWPRYVKGAMPGLPPLPTDIPLQPKLAYKHHGWSGWPGWRGNGRGRKVGIGYYVG
jgi:hypothetical protein